jgi:DNA (cytosine-5)-methyltransferase 1
MKVTDSLIRTSVLTIGENKGTPRIWIEGKYLKQAGFEQGQKVRTEYGQNQIIITLAPDGDKLVSGGRSAAKNPVLDYQNTDITRAMNAAKKIEVKTRFGQITITPAKSEVRLASRVSDGTCGSVFSGGGLLDEAAKEAGYNPTFAVEIDPAYADVFQSNHKVHMHASCISEVNLRSLPHVDLLTLGVPCEPFSQKRRNDGGTEKRKTSGPADHELADMSFWALMVVDATNPCTAIIENVPAYVESEIGQITMTALRRMGYNVEHRIIAGTEYGALTTRRRAVIVAATDAIEWPELSVNTRTLGEVLLPAEHPECAWFHTSDPSKNWLFSHWATQTAKGNGFASQQLTAETPAVQAISKRYFAGQGDAPVVRDVRREGWFRWLTLGEVKAIMGLSLTYDLGETKTFAGEVMGQGVLVDVFAKIIRAVAPRRVVKRRMAV